MCGFGMNTIFHVAIFLVVVIVVLSMLKWAFGSWFDGITGGPFGGLLRIVIGGVVAIVILLVLWRLAACAGLLSGSISLPLYG